MTRRRHLAGLGLLVGLAGLTPSVDAQTAPTVIVFSGEDNRLNVYDGATGQKQTVIPSADDDPVAGLDLNAQICFDPDHPTRFIAGEDTNQPNPPQHWGYFELHGTALGSFTTTELGRLTPTYQGTLDNAENYGCGFLSDGRLVTTDVGEQQPGTTPTGQLIVWFPPFDSDTVRHCKVDVAIATASGIHVDDGDRVYVAAARPGLPQTTDLAGVYRYDGSLPTSDDTAGGCGRTDSTGAPLADADRIGKTLFIPGDPLGAFTPSAIVPSPGGGFYVSSVFTGIIAEYDAGGAFVRRVLEPALGDVIPPYSTGTPYGLGIDSAGTLYYADLGVVLGPPPGPGDHNGTLRRIRFVDGDPQPPETIDTGLAFPDGIGILELAAAPAPVAGPLAASAPPAGTAATGLAANGPALAGAAALAGLVALRAQARRTRPL